MKNKKDKNKEAYNGLKKIGHNFASEPYDANLDYIPEWNEEKHNHNHFDSECIESTKDMSDDEVLALINMLSD